MMKTRLRDVLIVLIVCLVIIVRHAAIANKYYIEIFGHEMIDYLIIMLILGAAVYIVVKIFSGKEDEMK